MINHALSFVSFPSVYEKGECARFWSVSACMTILSGKTAYLQTKLPVLPSENVQFSRTSFAPEYPCSSGYMETGATEAKGAFPICFDNVSANWKINEDLII